MVIDVDVSLVLVRAVSFRPARLRRKQVRNLMESISTVGLVCPPRCHRMGGYYLVDDGVLRVQAMIELGFPRIEVDCD